MGITWYIKYIMNTKNTKTQQLRGADEAFWRQVKAAAALEGTTVTEWVEKVIGKKLHPNPKKK